jgi:prevent-host-death family protein
MTAMPLAEIKTHLSSVIKQVEAGREIVVSYGRRRDPVAVLVPYREWTCKRPRRLGSLQGKMSVSFAKDFSMTDEELVRG